MNNLKKNLTHWLIILITILLYLQSCSFVTPTKEGSKATNADAQATYIVVSGMTYLIVSTPQGVTLANVTKDSLEVLLRRRNEKYLEIANRQSQQK